MLREQVASSNIVSAGYDPDNETMEIEFTNGTVYQFFNVSEALYQQFLQAPSKGKFFNTYIKNAVPFSRV